MSKKPSDLIIYKMAGLNITPEFIKWFDESFVLSSKYEKMKEESSKDCLVCGFDMPVLRESNEKIAIENIGLKKENEKLKEKYEILFEKTLEHEKRIKELENGMNFIDEPKEFRKETAKDIIRLILKEPKREIAGINLITVEDIIEVIKGKFGVE